MPSPDEPGPEPTILVVPVDNVVLPWASEKSGHCENGSAR